MRGFPLLNLLALAGALAVLLIPLLRVDRPAAARRMVEPAAAVAPGVPVTLLLRAVHAPVSLEVTAEGKPVVWRGEGQERQAETTLTAGSAALELEVKATWPAGTPATLLELKAAPDGMEEQMRNVWAEGGMVEEIVRFTWRTTP